MTCIAVSVSQTADEILNSAKNIIVLDSLENQTTAKRILCCLSATFAESDGTLINNEGRAQRYFKIFMPAEPITGKLAMALGI